MNESIHKYFNVGLIHFMAYPDTLKESLEDTVIKILVDDYFDAIEITHISDESVRARIRDLIAQSHIKVCYGAQPTLLSGGLNPNSVDETIRQKAQDALVAAIDEAEFMGAKNIAFLSGRWDTGTTEENYDQLIKTTSYLCEYATAKDMGIELEVFDFDIDKKSLIGPAPLAAKFAAEMRYKFNNFGLLVDLSHFPLTYETSEFAFQVMKPYITHLHIGSAVLKEGADNYGDTHPRFGFPNGANDVPEVLDFLRVCRDKGFLDENNPITLSFEVKPFKDEDPDIVVANAKRVLNRAWALL